MNKDFTIENIISYIKETTGKVIDVYIDKFDNSITFSYNGSSVLITQASLIDYIDNTDNRHICVHQLTDFSNRLIKELNMK